MLDVEVSTVKQLQVAVVCVVIVLGVLMRRLFHAVAVWIYDAHFPLVTIPKVRLFNEMIIVIPIIVSVQKFKAQC